MSLTISDGCGLSFGNSLACCPRTSMRSVSSFVFVSLMRQVPFENSPTRPHPAGLRLPASTSPASSSSPRWLTAFRQQIHQLPHRIRDLAALPPDLQVPLHGRAAEPPERPRWSNGFKFPG